MMASIGILANAYAHLTHRVISHKSPLPTNY